MEHDIPFGNSNRENGPTFLDFPLFLGIFQWDEPTKRVPFTAEPKIPEILTKWKAPLVLESKALYENMSLLNERRYNSAKFRKFADVCMIQTSDLQKFREFEHRDPRITTAY